MFSIFGQPGFLQKSSPKRHVKYSVIDFVPSNNSIVANKLPLNPLEQFLRRIKSLLAR